VTDWSGGLYVSPGLGGSRSGALAATAWASLLHLGVSGLKDAAAAAMAAADEFRAALPRHLPELQLLGAPHSAIVAFGAARPPRGGWKVADQGGQGGTAKKALRHRKPIGVYALNELMSARGWYINALQAPPALHFCFTAAHATVVPALVADLRACLDELVSPPAGAAAPGKDGAAPLYGLSNISPDRGLVGEFLVAYQGAMLAP
jgi:sphinganine-1-phosphate aldolase